MQYNIKKIIPGLLIGIILLLVIIYYFSKQENNDINENNINQEEKIEDQNESKNNENSDQEQKNEKSKNEDVKEEEIVEENEITIKPEIIPETVKPEEKPKYEKDSKEDLEQRLNEAKEKDDYQSFADALGTVYEKGLEGDEDLLKIESEMYIKGTGYFDNSKIDKAYEMADIIYDKAFSSWRFRYLKIRCLEKYGRDEFEKGNYDKAEEYAMKILSIEFRFEGANLLCDVYVKKIEANLSSGDKEAALNNLNIIWDYEVDESHRNKLIELKDKIEN